MSILHIIKTVQALDDVIQVATHADKLILVEQAVYAASAQHKALTPLTGFALYALEADVAARAMTSRLDTQVKLVDFSGFVELTAEQASSITWE